MSFSVPTGSFTKPTWSSRPSRRLHRRLILPSFLPFFLFSFLKLQYNLHMNMEKCWGLCNLLILWANYFGIFIPFFLVWFLISFNSWVKSQEFFMSFFFLSFSHSIILYSKSPFYCFKGNHLQTLVERTVDVLPDSSCPV